MPEDIVVDILSRLPVKSLLQFRCVSKKWRSIIEDGKFVRSHLSRSLLSPSHHRLLLPTSLLLSVDYYNASSNMTNASMELDCPFVSQYSLIEIIGACNGLVCVRVDIKDLIIYNPSTRHSKALLAPKQPGSYSSGIDCVYGFGCSLNPLDFRVVVLSRFAFNSQIYPDQVFSQNDNFWHTRDLIRSFDFVNVVGTFLNGALHWVAYRGESKFVASFNVSEEAFKEMCLPPHNNILSFYSLGVLEGCLSVFRDTHGYTHVDIFVMKEYGMEKSWMKFIKVPYPTEHILYLVPLSFTKEGELLLQVDSKDFIAYDTKKNTFKDITVRDGPSWYTTAVVYVESLVSPNSD